MSQEKETHESYGTISFSRVNGPADMSLFSSSITHQNVIMVEVMTAERSRHLSQDWIHGNKVILQAVMSPAQFAEAITSLGQGGGTPITLEFVVGDEQRLRPPPAPRVREQFEAEVHESMAQSVDIVDELTPKTKGSVRRRLEILRGRLQTNLPFVQEQFARQMDKTVTEAKAEVEAYALSRHPQTAIPTMTQPREALPPAEEE